MPRKATLKPVLITTLHRGVFYAEISSSADLTQSTLTDLKNARMAIYWGTKRGVMELAEAGPNSNSKLSAVADIPVLHGVTAIFSVTEEASKKWKQQ